MRWTDQERLVYEALPLRAGKTADEIAVSSGLPPNMVLGPLTTLEIAGLIERREGGWRLARKGGGAATPYSRLRGGTPDS